MTENDSELSKRLVVGSKRDGRRRYDRQAKQELVQACLESGVSVAKMALDHGLNANLLRKWIDQYQHQDSKQHVISAVQPVAPRAAFIPVVQSDPAMAPALAPMRVQARLPNGVEIDFDGTTPQQLPSLLELLCKLPCSASTPA
jgi:transposase-like protein